jgi:hypothetical protein
MATAIASPAALIAANNAIWAASGTLGYLILLKPDLFSGAGTVNATTDVITTAAAHGLVTGSRVQLSTAGIYPALSSGAIASGTDYYAIVTGSTTLKLATTLALATAGTAINFTDTGTGTLTLSEQRPTVSDPVAVLINKELGHADYVRQAVTGATAQAVGEVAQQPAIATSYSPVATNMIYRQVLFLGGATSVIGNTTGTAVYLATETADITITPGAPKVILTTLRTKNA